MPSPWDTKLGRRSKLQRTPLRVPVAATSKVVPMDSPATKTRGAPPRGGAAVAALFLLGATAPSSSRASAEFNYEVTQRVLDRVSSYMRLPVDVNRFVASYRAGGSFPNDLRAADRDFKTKLDAALTLPQVYYGLEDGTFVGRNLLVGGNVSHGMYREPGNSGYRTDNPIMSKHFRSCVDESGSPQTCEMSPGTMYVRCPGAASGDGGSCDELEPCQDEESQRDCSALEDPADVRECEGCRKYCRKYSIEYAPKDGTDGGGGRTRLGFVPCHDHCHDVQGKFSEEPGRVVKKYIPRSNDPTTQDTCPLEGSGDFLGNCYFKDGRTLVNRTNVEGDYAYCGSDGEVCSGTYVGAYSSYDYDPRWRPWYILSKRLQRPAWTDPYPFFIGVDVGISATHPIYDKIDGRNIFAGVLTVDYEFYDIAKFLIDSYDPTEKVVAIYEDAEPNYIIGLSTGTPSVQMVLVQPGNGTRQGQQPCPIFTGRRDGLCEPDRVTMLDLLSCSHRSGGTDCVHMDRILSLSFQRHAEADYPEDLVLVRESDEVGSTAYLSQSALYEQPGANLKWRIVVTSPGASGSSSEEDASEQGQLVGSVVAFGTSGVLICLGLLAIFNRNRDKRAVIYADWRFTSAFIVGCMLLNGSTFTLLGPNTDATCLLRMWSFHMLFVAALSPLFVKIWRMKQLVGRSHAFQRKTITHCQAAMYCVPLIAVQAVICTLFSILDPPRQVEEIEVSEGSIVRDLICQTNTDALFITEAVFEAGLMAVGCVLAYRTRKIDKRFGESRQLIFAMYNIAVVALALGVAFVAADLKPHVRKILQAVGVFWGTVCSSSAFVVPRLLQVWKENRASDATACHPAKNSGRDATEIMTTTSAGARLGTLPKAACQGGEGLHREEDTEKDDRERHGHAIQQGGGGCTEIHVRAEGDFTEEDVGKEVEGSGSYTVDDRSGDS